MIKSSLLITLSVLIFTSLSAKEYHCTNLDDSFKNLAYKHLEWFQKIKDGKSKVKPSLVFAKDILMKTEIDENNNYTRSPFVQHFSKGTCYITTYLTSNFVDQEKNVLIKQGSTFTYGKEIRALETDGGDYLSLETEKLRISFFPAGFCKASDLISAAKEAGISFSAVHPANSPECIGETEVISNK